MTVFKVNIDRKVINWDRFTRFIEAETREDAEKISSQLAFEANSHCPDDAGSTDYDADLEGWEVNDIEEAEAEELFNAPVEQLHSTVKRAES